MLLKIVGVLTDLRHPRGPINREHKTSLEGSQRTGWSQVKLCQFDARLSFICFATEGISQNDYALRAKRSNTVND